MALKKAKVIKKQTLTYDVFELYLETEENFTFKAGQFITIKINDNHSAPCFRGYSILSPPRDKRDFTLCIKTIPGGRGSNWLNSLKEDDEIEFMGPNGNFIFQSLPEKTILFIATGTGIAPLKSIIEDQLENGNKQSMHLFFGLRHIKDLIYKDQFEELENKYTNFSFDLTLSQPENETWQGHKGRVTALLENLEIYTQNTETYICGLNAMIESVTEILKKKNLPEKSIHFEKYD